jgi:hypothetical protein
MPVKLLLAYDIKPYRLEEYYQFILGEFLPRASALGLKIKHSWHTAYGNYPERLVEFVAKDEETIKAVLSHEVWDTIETRLGEYVTDYEKQIVPLRPNFQFFIPRRRKLT